MAFATIDVTKGITGTTPVTQGGTGLTAGTTDQFLKFTGTTTLASAADNSGLITEHKALLESDVATKLRDAEDLILPLLKNLKRNPEKDYIHWPNRDVIIDKQIERITAVTRYFERI